MENKPNTRSMIFTLYGDYIRHYGNEIWIGSLIELLEAFDHNAQAVRAAVSRMSKQNWIHNRKEGNKSFYSLTDQGIKRVDEAAVRIYRAEPSKWDGQWRIVLYKIPEDKRQIRDELRKELSWSGMALLSNSVWVTPNDLSHQINDIIERYNINDYVHFFISENTGIQSDDEIVKECWDLDFINERYELFINQYKDKYETDYKKMQLGALSNKECFVKRTKLVHYFRKSLFIDPGLPKDLLPEKWMGEPAAKLFNDYYKILSGPADNFFKEVFSKGYNH